MLARTIAATLLTAALAVPAAPTRAAERPLHALRTLAYQIRMAVSSRRSIERAPVHSYDATHGDVSGAQETRGTIEVAVVAATADAGLVVDVSERATNRSRPSLRVAIPADGVLVYDPSQANNLSEEEDTLLRWLARGFYGDHPRAAGAAWIVDASGNGVADVVHYRVDAAAATTVTLHYDGQRSAHGLRAYDAARTGTLVYDTARVVPLHAAYQGWSHSGRFGDFETTDVSVELTLTADSFAK